MSRTAASEINIFQCWSRWTQTHSLKVTGAVGSSKAINLRRTPEPSQALLGSCIGNELIRCVSTRDWQRRAWRGPSVPWPGSRPILYQALRWCQAGHSTPAGEMQPHNGFWVTPSLVPYGAGVAVCLQCQDSLCFGLATWTLNPVNQQSTVAAC